MPGVREYGGRGRMSQTSHTFTISPVSPPHHCVTPLSSHVRRWQVEIATFSHHSTQPPDIPGLYFPYPSNRTHGSDKGWPWTGVIQIWTLQPVVGGLCPPHTTRSQDDYLPWLISIKTSYQGGLLNKVFEKLVRCMYSWVWDDNHCIRVLFVMMVVGGRARAGRAGLPWLPWTDVYDSPPPPPAPVRYPPAPQ